MNLFRTIFLSLLLILTSLTGRSEYMPTEENLKARKEFRDSGFGIFIHWGVYSMLGSGEWVLNRE